MNNNQLSQYADLIFSKLFSIDAENKTRDEKIYLIKSVIIDFDKDSRHVGRNQIINHISGELESLKS